MSTDPGPDGLLTATLREESARLVAGLTRRFHDFDLAEEAVQGAVLEALTRWRRDGPPANPAAWLQIAARHHALDEIRHRSRQRGLAERAGAAVPRTDWTVADVGEVDHLDRAAVDGDDLDDRVALLFGCCHPGLAPEARVALTLRAVMGLTTPQIAKAFLVGEATLAQRIVRAKRKIVTAGIALEVPPADRLTDRLADVLAVVYATYNEAFVSTTGQTHDRDLGADMVWLAGVIATSLPGEAEAWGLAALLTFQHGRSAARFDPDGDLVLLRDQDRRRWDETASARGEVLLSRAAALHAPGRYQLQAAIAACHSNAASWLDTDWPQIAVLYEMLLRYDPSPLVRLNHAVARSRVGPDPVRSARAALDEVDQLADDLAGYHLFHATRAELLRRLARPDEADAADRDALARTSNEAERRLIRTRLRRHPLTDGS